MTNFIDFGLDPGCKMLHKFKIRTGFGPSQLKRIAQFLLLKICIFYGLYLDLGSEFLKLFGLWLDLNRV